MNNVVMQLKRRKRTPTSDTNIIHLADPVDPSTNKYRVTQTVHKMGARYVHDGKRSSETHFRNSLPMKISRLDRALDIMDAGLSRVTNHMRI